MQLHNFYRNRKFALKGAIETLYAAQCFIELIKGLSEVQVDTYDHVSLPFFLSIQAASTAMRLPAGHYDTASTHDVARQVREDWLLDLTRRTFELASATEDILLSMKKRLEKQVNRLETDEIEEAISCLILEAENIVAVYDQMTMGKPHV